MVDSDVILGMDSFHAINRCQHSSSQVSVSNEPVLEWKNSSAVFMGRFISYFKAKKLVFKGCVYYLFHNDSSVEIPRIQLVSVEKDFP